MSNNHHPPVQYMYLSHGENELIFIFLTFTEATQKETIYTEFGT